MSNDLQKLPIEQVQDIVKRDKTLARLQTFIPAGADFNKFLDITLSVFRNDKLAVCSKKSLLLSIFDIFKIGLDPDPQKKYIYVIPYKNEAQVQVGVYGYVELMYRSGVKKLRVLTVYNNDEFEFGEENGVFVYSHKPYSVKNDMPKDNEDASGGVKCVMVWAENNDGSITAEVYGRDKLIKAKKQAQTSNVWDQWEDEQLKKTAVKNFAKYYRTNPEMQFANNVDTHSQMVESDDENVKDRGYEIVGLLDEMDRDIVEDQPKEGKTSVRKRKRKRKPKPEPEVKEEAVEQHEETEAPEQELELELPDEEKEEKNEFPAENF